MSEKRFWFVIDKGKLEYVQDNVSKEKITVSELEDLLNDLNEENQELKRLIKKMGELGGFNKHLIKTICGDLE